MYGPFLSWIATLLSNSWSVMWARMSACQERKDKSVSVEYPPLNLVILGLHIWQNSFDACAAAAETSAAMVAAFWGLPDKGAIWLTSNVLFCGNVLVPLNGMEVWRWLDKFGNVGSVPDMGWLDDFLGSALGLRSGLLVLSSNLTCFWNENGWSCKWYWAAPLCWFTLPGRILKTSSHNPASLEVDSTKARLAWLAKDNSSECTWSCVTGRM